MAWENLKVEQQRLQLITAYIQKESSMTDLCKRFGVSRKTAYKWYKIFLDQGEEEGEKGLIDRSKRPHEPYRIYTDTQLQTAIDLKLKYRTWGPKKLVARLRDIYPDDEWPSATRMYEILKDHHLVSSRKLRNRVPATAPLGQLTACNDTWAVDLKGWFLTGDGRKCEPLTITDCFSRYLFKCIHLEKHSVNDVWSVFESAFIEYGLPLKVRSDNGPPFGSLGVGRFTRLSVNLIKAGVMPEWIRPGHPEENGRHERFHLTLKQETAMPPKETLLLQIQAMNQFHHEYNFNRPHEALEMKTPADYYSPSPRKWNGILKSPEYDVGVKVRKVKENGLIKLDQKEYYIGRVLGEEYVALQKDDMGHCKIYYGPVYLGKIDERDQFKTPKMPTRKHNYAKVDGAKKKAASED